MPKATWNGKVIAEAAADTVEIVEGNVYFAVDDVRREYLRSSTRADFINTKGTRGSCWSPMAIFANWRSHRGGSLFGRFAPEHCSSV
jgi:uncharacterized protein (DUF427 family)